MNHPLYSFSSVSVKKLLSVILLVVLTTSNIFADVVLYNGDTEIDHFQDVGAALNYTTPGNKVLVTDNTATHNETATAGFTSFTVKSDSDSVRTITVGASPLYKFSSPNTSYQITHENLKYQGNGGEQQNGQQFIKIEDASCALQLTFNNTTFSNFGANIFSSVGDVSFVNCKNFAINDTYFQVVSSGTGGLIYSEKNVSIRDSENITFYHIQGPRLTGQSFPGIAIYCKGNLTISNTKNMEVTITDAMYGKVFVCEGSVYFDNSTFKMYKTGGWLAGGAIVTSNAYFSGDNAVVDFYSNCQGDLYLSKKVDGKFVKSELSFTDKGTYSFTSGIFVQPVDDVDDYSGNSTTTIDQARVTISGRTDDDPYIDNKPRYRLQAATVSNNAELIVNLDYIEAFNGIFNLDNTAKMELNVLDASRTKKLTMLEDGSVKISNDELVIQGSGKLSKGGAGTLQILAEAEGLVSAESFVVSSGRLDYKGYFTGNVIVSAENDEANPIFSPGNSVGTANVKGNVVIEDGSILFEFGSYPGDDSNHDVLNITNGRFSADDGMINLYFENDDAATWAAEEKFEYLLVSGGGFANREYTSMLGNYLDTFKLLGKNGNLYLVDMSPILEPVPEPSTWALLALGAAGLMYLRKRVRS